jgi:hypothetical protein
MAQQDIKDESIYNPSGTVNVAKVELSERTLSILALVFGVAGLLISILSSMWARDSIARAREDHHYEMQQVRADLDAAKREVRVMQQISMDRDALLLRAGLLQSSDAVNGPAYNVQYRPKGKR